MVKKGVKFSAEHRKKLSEAQKKLHEGKPKICSIKDCGKKVHGYGYCSSHYYKKKTYGNPLHIVKPKKRGSPSEETRRKIGAANKITAKKFWKKLTKEEKAERIKKPGFFKKGQTPWVKGKKATPETRKKQSRSALHRFETQKHPMEGKRHGKATRKLILEARLKQKPMNNTVPEKLMRKMLKDLGIKFEEQIGIKEPACQPDFFIQPKILIFTDGDRPHANPNPHLIPSRRKKIYPGYKDDYPLYPSRNITAKDMRRRDRRITRGLKKNGYTVLRFWQSELETKPEKCLKKILKAIKA
tara:strand:+ start:56 stop:952 length:897 start_codon:yes stop_codon:yes gene_type:complete